MTARSTASRRDQERPGIGLILPGGGAKGAYQAGATLYLAEVLAERGGHVAAIAGSSVGALNGAVLASAPDLLQGARKLQTLWRAIGALPPAELEIFRRLPSIELGTLLSLLTAAGASSPIDRLLHAIADLVSVRSAGSQSGSIVEAARVMLDFKPELIANPTLQQFLRDALSVDALRDGIPLHVSVYRSNGPIEDAIRFVLANLARLDTAHSELLHVQSLPEEMQHDAILASAAIPFIFDAKVLHGGAYADGGLGGWRTQQGQVPARELCDSALLNGLVVLHCSDGSLWDRGTMDLPPVIEVRPTEAIGTGRPVHDMLSADSEAIETRLQRGYDDARKCLEPALDAVGRVIAVKAARLTLRRAMGNL